MQVIAATGVLAGVRLSTASIYLIAAVPLVIAALIASVIWRSAKRERVSRALRSRLESPNPKTRREALDMVTDEVLSEHGELLCELLTHETDHDVLDALAAAVARSKWEPTDDEAILQLRRWVAGGQVRTTKSSGTAAAPADEVVVTTPTWPAVAPSERAATSSPTPFGVPVAAAASANGRESQPSERPVGTPVRSGDATDLVHKVREVLGDGVERVELVSIDGELLESWSSAQHAHADAPPAGEDA
jgi:hypothetical protein